MNIDLKNFFIYYNTSANTNELIKNWNNKAQGSSYKKSLCEGVCVCVYVCVSVCVCVGGREVGEEVMINKNWDLFKL